MLKGLLAIPVVAAALLALTAVASADHSWNGYHWARTSNPFTLKLETDLTPTATSNWPAILPLVSNDWSASTVLDTAIVDTAAPKGNCRAISGEVRVCNRQYGSTGWLGLATVYLTGSHITSGTVKVNDSYFSTSAYNDPNLMRHVLCQEVGHTFGLDHQHNVTNSCMNDASSTFFLASAVSPNQHDYDELGLIYSHADGTTTVKSSSASGTGASAQADDAVPAGAGPKDGKVFVRDLGGGRLMMTFVIWAR